MSSNMRFLLNFISSCPFTHIAMKARIVILLELIIYDIRIKSSFNDKLMSATDAEKTVRLI